MRAFLAASLLAASLSAAAQQPSPKPEAAHGTDALMALAWTYGVVRYYHPGESVETLDWPRFLVHAAERAGATPPAGIAPLLEELFAPVVEGFRVLPAGSPAGRPAGEGPRVEWRHLGYGLEADASVPYASWRTYHPPIGHGKVQGSYFQNRAEAEKRVHAEPVMRLAVAAGLEAHVPVSLPLSASRIGPAQRERLDRLAAVLGAVRPAGEPVSRAQAHADGIAAWNVAAHFHPYRDALRLDWEATLREWLAAQPPAQDRQALHDALRRLTAPLEDGQLRIGDPQDKVARRALPISVRPAGGEWVVDYSRHDSVKAGDVVVAIDGVPAQRWFGEREALASGSPQVRPWRARLDLLAGREGERVALRLRRGRETREASLAHDSPQLLQGPRPGALQEVRPGIHYVDLSRFDKAAFDAALPRLAEARGIIFDLRGPPSADAHRVVPYWLSGPDAAQWMLVPRFDRPFGRWSGGWSTGWQRTRDASLEKPVKVLLTDARTLGYGESLAAYFPAQRTGPVVGEPTGGANGNPARATLPSGMQLHFSAMRIARHDGRSYYREGLAPDHAVHPTAAGLAAGRDEVLERAVDLVERPGGR